MCTVSLVARKMNALWFCYGWQVLIRYSRYLCRVKLLLSRIYFPSHATVMGSFSWNASARNVLFAFYVVLLAWKDEKHDELSFNTRWPIHFLPFRWMFQTYRLIYERLLLMQINIESTHTQSTCIHLFYISNWRFIAIHNVFARFVLRFPHWVIW